MSEKFALARLLLSAHSQNILSPTLPEGKNRDRGRGLERKIPTLTAH